MFTVALHEWCNGKVPTNLHGTVQTTSAHARRTREQDLINGEVVVEGVPMAEGETIQHRHVYWVRTEGVGFVACYKRNGTMEELPHQMCQTLWSSIPTRCLLGGNERMLPTGTKIPLVPHKYYLYKLQHAERARIERARPRVMNPKVEEPVGAEAVPRTASDTFCMCCMPSAEELRSSTIHPPHHDFYTPEQPVSSKPMLPTERLHRLPRSFGGAQLLRDEAWCVLHQARMQILAHPTYRTVLAQDPLDGVTSLEQLPQLTVQHRSLEVPISKEMIRWFHHFFPLEESVAV